MKRENNVFIRGEQGIVVPIAHSVGMLGARLQLHEIDDIDDPYFKVRQMLAKD